MRRLSMVTTVLLLSVGFLDLALSVTSTSLTVDETGLLVASAHRILWWSLHFNGAA